MDKPTERTYDLEFICYIPTYKISLSYRTSVIYKAYQLCLIWGDFIYYYLYTDVHTLTHLSRTLVFQHLFSLSLLV